MGLFKKAKKEENGCCCCDVDKLTVKEGSEKGCSCDNVAVAESNKKESTSSDNTTIIKILGSGCKNCITLTENVKQALQEMKLEAQIEKVTDFAEITAYGVLTTPALVVNEKVVSYGKVLKPNEVAKILDKVIIR